MPKSKASRRLRPKKAAKRPRREDRKHRHYRQQSFLHQHSISQVRQDLWQLGIGHVKSMDIRVDMTATSTGQSNVPVSVGLYWKQIGPAPLRIDQEQAYQGAAPVSGEVTDIAIDPVGVADKIIYLASNDGGVWKSVDGGTSWLPETDLMPSLSMGAVAIDPVDSLIVYAGTGNLFDGGVIFTKGTGIYKSIDGGETWSIVGNSILSNRGINRIVLPNSNVLLVATESGLFRSVDGGLNFGSNSPLFNDGLPILSGYVSDLRLDTGSPSITVYAAISGEGIFMSNDGGHTFPINLFNNNGAPTRPYGFITFTQSVQPDKKTFYASVSTSWKEYNGLFKSLDGGETWSILLDASSKAAENGGLQAAYDQTVGVDPQDANRIYIGFQELYVSTDGGLTFGTPAISQGKIHWDHHALIFSPRTHWQGKVTQLYVGTDGGISTSNDGGNSWQNLNETIATNIFLGIDIGRGNTANNGFTFGGCQDTGTIEHSPEFAELNWHLGVDGDGGPVAVDPVNPLRVYGSDNGQYMVTDDGGENWNFPAEQDRANRTGLFRVSIYLLAIDPANSKIVYATAGKKVFQSVDNGSTFVLMHTFPFDITSIAIATSDSNTVWVGLQHGTVHKTANALSSRSSTWVEFFSGLPVGRSADGIAIDPSDHAKAVVVYSGFSGISPTNRTQHIYMTSDSGTTWNDISGTDGQNPMWNLPDLPLHSVVIDRESTIIVASDAAVMRTTDLGRTWHVLGVGLPTVDCKSLVLDSSVSPPLLRVGTYGRSTFELATATGPKLIIRANLAFGSVSTGSAVNLSAQMFNVGSSYLIISGFVHSTGSTDFQISPEPNVPITVAPGGEADCTIQFRPSTIGNVRAIFQISSNDNADPTQLLPASGIGI